MGVKTPESIQATKDLENYASEFAVKAASSPAYRTQSMLSVMESIVERMAKDPTIGIECDHQIEGLREVCHLGGLTIQDFQSELDRIHLKVNRKFFTPPTAANGYAEFYTDDDQLIRVHGKLIRHEATIECWGHHISEPEWTEVEWLAAESNRRQIDLTETIIQRAELSEWIDDDELPF